MTPTTVRKLRILFVCTGNSCRSQMAEGWARHLKGEDLSPFSAGIYSTRIDPLAIRVMAEVGIDISVQGLHRLKDFALQSIDYVVSVCDGAAQECFIFPPSVKVVTRTFDDPVALSRLMETETEKLAVYRRVRDEIRELVECLPAALEELG